MRSSRVVYDGRLARVRVDTLGCPDGSTVEREIVEHPDAVAVVAVEDDGNVVLLRQYRHAVGQHELELPAGILDVDGEAPQQAAERELAEEVGLAARRLVPLVTFHNSGGWTDESTTVYLAEGVHPVAGPDEYTAEAEEADMEVVRLPLAEALDLAAAGEISDAKTLIGLLLVSRRSRAEEA